MFGTLDSEQVKDEHLKVLAQALALKSLDASDTLISDAELVHLSSLKNLRWLDVGTSDRHDKCMFLFGWLMTKSHCKATENELQSLKRFCEEHPGPVAN